MLDVMGATGGPGRKAEPPGQEPLTNATRQGHASDGVALQRARGEVRLSFKTWRGATVLDTLRQAGVGKARLPDPGPGRPVEAVLLNTAGGLTDGDIFEVEAGFAPATRAVITTQASEKVYRSRGRAAHVTTRLTIGAGAHAEWLPQDTILFDKGRLDRRLEVDMAGDATALLLESVVLGRTAMGETVREGHLIDRWRLRREGRLIYADGLVLGGDIRAHGAARATLAGHLAFATLVLVSPEAESRLEAARALLAPLDCECGASAWNGLLALRLLARDGAMLRRDLVRLLTGLRGPLPRVWMC
jgi:urease accessory protein